MEGGGTQQGGRAHATRRGRLQYGAGEWGWEEPFVFSLMGRNVVVWCSVLPVLPVFLVFTCLLSVVCCATRRDGRAWRDEAVAVGLVGHRWRTGHEVTLHVKKGWAGYRHITVADPYFGFGKAWALPFSVRCDGGIRTRFWFWEA